MRDWQYRLLLWRMVDDSEEAIWESVRVPETWIRGLPIPARVDLPHFAGGLLRAGIKVTQPELRGGLGHTAPCLIDSVLSDPGWHAWQNELPAVNASEAHIHLTIRVWARSAYGAPVKVEFEREYTRTFHIRLLPDSQASREQIASPVQDTKAETALLNAMHFEVGLNGYGTLIVYDYWLAPFQDTNPFDLEFHYDAEVFDGDNLVWRQSCGPAWSSGGHFAGAEQQKALFERLRVSGDSVDAGDLTLRITPRPDLALQNLDCERYWVPADGSAYIEIPLSQVARVIDPRSFE